MRSALLLAPGLWLGSLLVAQEAAKPLENAGQPMQVAFQCTEDEIRTFGLTCPAQQPCPVYLDLSGLESAGVRIFVPGNIHTEAATLSSILLASEDGGKTWYEPQERIRAAGLDQIQFFDLATGWISGQTLGAVPRDPFFLLTTDGGKTWRARPVWDDSRVGAVDWFHFDSNTHGTLWIDRSQAGEGSSYELYESMTGGESWMLRQTSDRPVRKEGSRPSVAGSLRLRADAVTKSYHLEKQVGERWQPLASFLIHIADCKQPEPVLPAEPPPAPEDQPPPQPAQATPTPAQPKPPSLKKPQS